MKIFPAIDIKDGKCVRLVKRDFEKKKLNMKGVQLNKLADLRNMALKTYI